MALLTCPDCSRQISDAASACIGCGRPVSLRKDDAIDSISPTERESGIRCPSCGGGTVRKFSLLHEENRSTSTTVTRGGGVGLSTGGHVGVGLGSATSKGVGMTDLARRVAPPDRNQMASQEHHLGIPMLLALAVGVATYFTLGLLWAGLASVVVLFTAGIIGAIRAAPEVDRRYAAAFKAWNEKFLCMQCGAVMKVKFCDGVPRIEPVEENLNIDNLIRVGQTIQAIKLLREQTGLGLAEAKARVDARAVELRQS